MARKRKRKKMYNPNVSVFCTNCRKWVTERTVQMLNVEEDFEGFDNATFKHYNCNNVSTSRVRV